LLAKVLASNGMEGELLEKVRIVSIPAFSRALSIFETAYTQ
jgi:hypothetical protein